MMTHSSPWEARVLLYFMSVTRQQEAPFLHARSLSSLNPLQSLVHIFSTTISSGAGERPAKSHCMRADQGGLNTTALHTALDTHSIMSNKAKGLFSHSAQLIKK